MIGARSGHIVFNPEIKYSDLAGIYEELLKNFLTKTHQLPEDELFIKILINNALNDLKKKDFIRTHVMLSYIQKYKNRIGITNFKPVLRVVIRKLNFMEAQGNPITKVIEMAAMARDLLKEL